MRESIVAQRTPHLNEKTPKLPGASFNSLAFMTLETIGAFRVLSNHYLGYFLPDHRS
jgi:hypothetical protein